MRDLFKDLRESCKGGDRKIVLEEYKRGYITLADALRVIADSIDDDRKRALYGEGFVDGRFI